MSRTSSRASGDQDFFEQKCFSRRSVNVLNGILALSVRQKDASGVDLCPFECFLYFCYLGGIVGRPS